MPARSLIFIRHSLPEIDPTTPASTWQLSVEGRQRCLSLASQLTAYQPVRIISSREPKAFMTAELLAQGCGLRLETAEGLHEHERLHTPFTNRKHFIAQVKEFFAQPGKLIFGEESADQAYDRFSGVVDSLLQVDSALNLVVVTHGSVMALWAGRRLGLDPFSFWQSQTMPCLLVCDPFEGKALRFIRYNEALDSYE
jgi:broad specificity phosphatase PhoE